LRIYLGLLEMRWVSPFYSRSRDFLNKIGKHDEIFVDIYENRMKANFLMEESRRHEALAIRATTTFVEYQEDMAAQLIDHITNDIKEWWHKRTQDEAPKRTRRWRGPGEILSNALDPMVIRLKVNALDWNHEEDGKHGSGGGWHSVGGLGCVKF
jgi:hypothetical protein